MLVTDVLVLSLGSIEHAGINLEQTRVSTFFAWSVSVCTL